MANAPTTNRRLRHNRHSGHATASRHPAHGQKHGPVLNRNNRQVIAHKTSVHHPESQPHRRHCTLSPNLPRSGAIHRPSTAPQQQPGAVYPLSHSQGTRASFPTTPNPTSPRPRTTHSTSSRTTILGPSHPQTLTAIAISTLSATSPPTSPQKSHSKPKPFRRQPPLDAAHSADSPWQNDTPRTLRQPRNRSPRTSSLLCETKAPPTVQVTSLLAAKRRSRGMLPHHIQRSRHSIGRQRPPQDVLLPRSARFHHQDHLPSDKEARRAF